MKLILHIKDGSDGILALRAARHLIDHPEKADAVLQYGGDAGTEVWARRNKASITAYELTTGPSGSQAGDSGITPPPPPIVSSLLHSTGDTL